MTVSPTEIAIPTIPPTAAAVQPSSDDVDPADVPERRAESPASLLASASRPVRVVSLEPAVPVVDSPDSAVPVVDSLESLESAVSGGSTAESRLADRSLASGAVVGTEQGEALKETIPLRKLGQPEDVANAAVFLASDLAGHVTAESLLVDGGARNTS